MKAQLIMSGIVFVLKSIKPKDLEAVADRLLDIVEIKYVNNDIAMKGCRLIREAFDIEDDD